MCRKGYASHADEKVSVVLHLSRKNDVLDLKMFQYVPTVQRMPAFVRSFARPTRLDPTRSYKDAGGVHGSHIAAKLLAGPVRLMPTMPDNNGSHFSPPARWGLLDFIRSCSPPPPPSPLPSPVFPRPCPHQLPPALPPCQLFDKLFANFQAQCALLDLNLGPSQLSAHCWTSTWDLPSSVRTAGPQPGTFPAQCAPMDLNLGPSQLNAHRWTSTWGFCQCAPLDLKSQIKCQKICQIECQIECEKICQTECLEICQVDCQIKCQIACQIKCQNVCQIECQKHWVDNMPEDMPDRMPENISDRMPADLPVTKCINVMVGITRSNVFFPPPHCHYSSHCSDGRPYGRSPSWEKFCCHLLVGFHLLVAAA